MKIKILAFGIIKDIFKGSEIQLEINEYAKVSELKNKLEDDFPEIKKLKSYFIAVDDEYADDDLVLKSNNEIAIIPPVSGG